MKKTYTEFGLFLLRLRQKNFDTLKDCSKKLGISVQLVSAIEHGDREIPSGLRQKIIDAYDLSSEEIKEMDDALAKTPCYKKFTFEEFREAMVNFIDNICPAEEDRKKLIEDLERRLQEIREKSSKRKTKKD